MGSILRWRWLGVAAMVEGGVGFKSSPCFSSGASGVEVVTEGWGGDFVIGCETHNV